ncbi:hypothetical protein OSTOST_07590 [Ostertagia ostertagi]
MLGESSRYMPEFCVFSSETFDIIQEANYYNEIYKDISVQLDESLFEINGPFMMESQFNAMKKLDRRVRKRKCQSLQNEKDVEEINTISKLSTSIRDEGFRIAFFSRQLIKDNNRHAREKAREVVNGSINMYRPAAIVSTEIISLSENRQTRWIMDEA